MAVIAGVSIAGLHRVLTEQQREIWLLYLLWGSLALLRAVMAWSRYRRSSLLLLLIGALLISGASMQLAGR